jgi:hypothetical protein
VSSPRRTERERASELSPRLSGDCSDQVIVRSLPLLAFVICSSFFLLVLAVCAVGDVHYRKR